MGMLFLQVPFLLSPQLLDREALPFDIAPYSDRVLLNYYSLWLYQDAPLQVSFHLSLNPLDGKALPFDTPPILR